MSEEFLRATISIRAVVCRPDGTVLVVRRSSDGGWELPGGRIHRKEAVVDCLRRELDEEVGLAVDVHTPVNAVSWHNESGDDRFAVYYHCTTEDSTVQLSDEHTDAQWVADETAREQLSGPQSNAIDRAVATDPNPLARSDD